MAGVRPRIATHASAPTRVGLTQFMDDNVLRSSSWGAQRLGFRSLEHAAEGLKAEFRYGPGKTECMAKGFFTRRPQGKAAFTDTHDYLGIPLDEHTRLAPLMKQVEGRAEQGWASVLTAIELLGLPVDVALRGLPARVEPRACFAAPFLLLRPD